MGWDGMPGVSADGGRQMFLIEPYVPRPSLKSACCGGSSASLIPLLRAGIRRSGAELACNINRRVRPLRPAVTLNFLL